MAVVGRSLEGVRSVGAVKWWQRLEAEDLPWPEPITPLRPIISQSSQNFLVFLRLGTPAAAG
jgi:hypothetical protein